MPSTAAVVAGTAAALGIGWLLLRPKKTKATSVGCFDQEGVKAWAIQNDVNSLLLIRSQHDLALVPVTGTIQFLVIGDSCEVWKFQSNINKFRLNQEATQDLRDFLASLIPVQGQTVSGVVQWI